MYQEKYLPEGRLSTRYANKERVRTLESLEKSMRDGEILEGRCILCDSDHNLHIELGGLRGIIPREECVYSLGGERAKDIAIISRAGKNICFKVTNITQSVGEPPQITLSRREAQRECYENHISKLRSGDIINARVTHLESFGCFVDIGCGIISLLSIDSMSVSRITHPKDRFVLGQCIKVIIKTPANESGRIILTHKELLGTWDENIAFFSAGQTAAGIIRSVESYGIFIELMPNLAGLAELKDGAEAGQHAAVYIKNIIRDKMKVKLVLIDSYFSDSIPSQNHYFIDAPHIDYWRYSPEGSEKLLETRFQPCDL